MMVKLSSYSGLAVHLLKKFFNKIVFLPIEVLEPKPYKAFITKDLKAYFKKCGLIIKAEKHCDYSKVLILKKMAG